MTFRILAVDDNPVVTQLIDAVLRTAGYDVETAPGAAEALIALQRNPPDLMLLDLEMDGMDGLELLALMADKRVCTGLPVLMLTGENDAHFIARARELGAAGYLTKPIRARDLEAKVGRLLNDMDTVWLDDHHAVKRASPDAA